MLQILKEWKNLTVKGLKNCHNYNLSCLIKFKTRMSYVYDFEFLLYKLSYVKKKIKNNTFIVDIDDQNVQMYGFASKSSKLHT